MTTIEDTAAAQRTLSAFERALTQESHNLSSWPELTWQQLYNRLQWDERRVADLLDIERRRRAAEGAWWLRSSASFRESEVLLRVLTGHTDAIYGCDISPTQSSVVSASADGTVRLWDTETGHERAVLRAGKEIWCCRFSPDGSWVAAGGMGSTHWLWHPELGEITPRRHLGGPITSCDFSPDGAKIIFGCGDGLRMWDVVNGDELFAIDGPAVSACGFSPAGDKIVCGGFDKLEIRRARDGEVISVFDTSGSYATGRISSCVFSPDGSIIASTDRYHDALHLWDAVTGEIRATLIHGSPIWGCRWTPDGRFVVAALNDQTLRISNARTGEERATLEGHAGTVFACVIGSRGTVLVSGSMDGTLRVWDLDSLEGAGAHRRSASSSRLHEDAVLGMDVSRDGSSVVSSSHRGTIAICDAESGAERVRMRESYTGGVTGCAFGPDGSLVITAHYDGSLVLWDAQNGAERAMIGSLRGGIMGGVRDCAVSPDGSLVVAVNGDGTLTIFDPDDLWARGTWRELGRIEASERELYTCSVAPDASFIISAGHDGVLKIWDARTWDERGTLQGHTAPVMDSAVSPDGSRVASASADHTLRIWDAQKWEEEEMLGHSAPVSGCAISPDALLLMSASQDGTLRLWSAETKRELGLVALPGGLTKAVFHPFTPRVFCGGRGGDLYPLELVAYEYGPIVVTPRHDGGDRAFVRCPKCWGLHGLGDGWLGRIIDCPTPTCDLRLRVNPSLSSIHLSRGEGA